MSKRTKEIICGILLFVVCLVIFQLVTYHLLCIQSDNEWVWTPAHRMIVGNEAVLLIASFFGMFMAWPLLIVKFD